MVLLAVGIAVFVVITAIALILHDARRAGSGSSSSSPRLLFLAVLVLLSRPKAVADAGGLTVVNLTGKRRLDWAEVLGVNLRPATRGSASTSPTAPAWP